MLVSHLFPGLTWFNVWDLPFYIWRGYASSADQWQADQERAGKS